MHRFLLEENGEERGHLLTPTLHQGTQLGGGGEEQVEVPTLLPSRAATSHQPHCSG